MYADGRELLVFRTFLQSVSVSKRVFRQTEKCGAFRMEITSSPPVAGCRYPRGRDNFENLLLERLFDCNCNGDGGTATGEKCGAFRRLSKNCPTKGFGGRKSVKGNRQGSLSRSITRRSDQNCKIILQILILQFCRQLVKKVQKDFFDKLRGCCSGNNPFVSCQRGISSMT